MPQDFKSHFKNGEHLFKHGDAGDCAFIIENGTVEVYINKADKKLIIATLKSGDLVGEMAIIDQLPRTASCMATEDTDVTVIPRDYVDQKIEYSDPTVRFFLKVIMERYRDMHSRLMQVVDGVNPDESTYQDMYTATSNVVKNLMDQYMEMQDRVMTAVNTAAPLPVASRKAEDFAKTKKSLSIEKEILQALDQEEFVVYYQPIINLQQNCISGCEALVRWQHPERGFIGPFDFIPHAENSGLIIPLGYWITEQACQFQRHITQQFLDPFFTNINLSGKQFVDLDLVDNLSDLVEKHASSASGIKFEITESLLMNNPELANHYLEQLKECGVNLAIDDFGTGYSSLSYLHQFPLDTLKIDRSFVSTMLQNKKSNEIVKSLIDLSHNLGMDVVAEGIETEFEEKIIKDYQAEYGQGYLYAKPMSAADFEQLLSSNQNTRISAQKIS